jgi:hypothetical protein
MRTHKNSREFPISFPCVHRLLGVETQQVYKHQVHKSLYKCEIPTIAENPKEKTNMHKNYCIT